MASSFFDSLSFYYTNTHPDALATNESFTEKYQEQQRISRFNWKVVEENHGRYGFPGIIRQFLQSLETNLRGMMMAMIAILWSSQAKSTQLFIF
jgi:hypothetical protein